MTNLKEPISIYNLIIYLDILFIFIYGKKVMKIVSKTLNQNSVLSEKNTKIYEFNYKSIIYFDTYLSKKNNDFFLLMEMNRIFQGVEYLHLNSLTHYDIKLSNAYHCIYLFILKYSHVWCFWRWTVTNENDAETDPCNTET